MYRKIIIVGYPKSGNTWITRLVAELINCPIKGLLYRDYVNEIAVEGLERLSKYECFKSHHQLHELNNEDINNVKIIYVIRDPRDILLSGIFYFYKSCFLFKCFHLNKLPFKIHQNKVLMGVIKICMKRGMEKAIFQGNKKIHYWCRVSWKNHIIPYLNNPRILKVKYEDMLKSPLLESKRILGFIGIDKSDQSIIDAINKQSFSVAKQKFLNLNDFEKYNFLRRGTSEQWKDEFSPKENLKFLKKLRFDLTMLNYQEHF